MNPKCSKISIVQNGVTNNSIKLGGKKRKITSFLPIRRLKNSLLLREDKEDLHFEQNGSNNNNNNIESSLNSNINKLLEKKSKVGDLKLFDYNNGKRKSGIITGKDILHFLRFFRRNWSSLRQQCSKGNKNVHTEINNVTIDVDVETVTHSHIHKTLSFNFIGASNPNKTIILSENNNMVSSTGNSERFLVNKWLEDKYGPNQIMYKASSEMLRQVWYWGEISRRDAQKELANKPTGTFLVRDSESDDCQFTLSFRIINMTLHYRLEYRDSCWHFEELQYESIVKMIDDILYRCTNDNFVCFVKMSNEMQPPIPVILKYPLSRYINMPKLQDLCRCIIQRILSYREIEKLPIPQTLKDYLTEKHEMIF